MSDFRLNVVPGVDVFHSPDDDGWYWQSYRDGRSVGSHVSGRVFATAEEAIQDARRTFMQRWP